MRDRHDIVAVHRLYRGFTLIELLIVIAIITVLITMIGLVAPVIQDRIKMTHCQRNLKTIHEILFSYSAQNNSWFPEFSSSYGWSLSHTYKWDDGSSVTKDVWEAMSDVAQLKKLGGSAEVFFCPLYPEYGNYDDWQFDSWEHPYTSTSTWPPGSQPTHSYAVSLGYYFLINRGGPYYMVNALSDGRYPIRMDTGGQDDMPIVADLLHTRTSADWNHGWYHGGGPELDEGLFNSDCNTLFFGGYVVWKNWEDLDEQGPGSGTSSSDKFFFWLGHEEED